MLLSQLHDFLIASVGASASFIGLLYVALTLVMQRSDNNVSDRDHILAASAYVALVTIFFISLTALLPDADISWVILVFGILGLMQSLRMVIQVSGKKVVRENRFITAALITIYFLIALYGFFLVFLHATLDAGIFYAIIFFLYGIALGRAWSLIGL